MSCVFMPTRLSASEKQLKGRDKDRIFDIHRKIIQFIVYLFLTRKQTVFLANNVSFLLPLSLFLRGYNSLLEVAHFHLPIKT